MFQQFNLIYFLKFGAVVENIKECFRQREQAFKELEVLIFLS